MPDSRVIHPHPSPFSPQLPYFASGNTAAFRRPGTVVEMRHHPTGSYRGSEGHWHSHGVGGRCGVLPGLAQERRAIKRLRRTSYGGSSERKRASDGVAAYDCFTECFSEGRFDKIYKSKVK